MWVGLWLVGSLHFCENELTEMIPAATKVVVKTPERVMVVRVSQGTLNPLLFHLPVLTILGPSCKSCLPTSLCSHWPLSP